MSIDQLRRSYNERLKELVKKKDDGGMRKLLLQMKEKGISRDKTTWSQILLLHIKRNNVEAVKRTLSDINNVCLLYYLFINSLTFIFYIL